MRMETLTAAVAHATAGHNQRVLDAKAFLSRHYRYARTYDLTLDDDYMTLQGHGGMDEPEGTRADPAVPSTLTWVTPHGLSGPGADLMVGHVPILRENWHFDPDTQKLTFHQGKGAQHISGVLHILGVGARMTGQVQAGARIMQMSAILAPVYYDCLVAKDAVDKAGTKSVTLKWDTSSDEWKNAPWSSERVFRLTYQITREGTYGGQSVLFAETEFEDRSDPNNPVSWRPAGGGGAGYIAYATPSMYFDFDVMASAPPTTSPYFPLRLQVQMNADTSAFDGAMLCTRPDINGNAYGLQGIYSGVANGVFAVEDGATTVSVLTAVQGRFRVAGQDVPHLRCTPKGVVWQDLPEDLQSLTGLPASGSIPLSRSGRFGRNRDTKLALRQIPHADARRHARKAKVAVPLADTEQMLATETLSIHELEGFSQFGKPNGQQSWTDIVRQKATTDTYNILLFYMDDDLREKFVSVNKPTLDPEIKGIAAMKGPKGEDPAPFYQSLGVAYVTGSLGQSSSDQYAAYLNWKRAAAWMNDQFTNSAVMQVQTPALYALRYAEVNAVGKYLEDQANNDARYTANLGTEIDEWIENTVALAAGDPKAQAAIRSDMEALKTATLDDRRYWAYVMCRTFISPNFLAFLQAISVDPNQGSEASAFARRIQETTALLSVLDPSGLFAKKFTKVFEAFNLAVIIPTLVDYSGSADDMLPGIEAALAAFVQKYEGSTTPEMAEAAQALKTAMANQQIQELLDIFANTMSGVAGSYAFEGAIERFESKAGTLIATGADAVVTGLMLAAVSMAIVNLVTGTTKWEDLSAGEQAAFIVAAVSFISMAIVKVVVRGVAVSVVLAADEGVGTAFLQFFNPFLMRNAQKGLSYGVKGWLVGGNSLEDEISGLQIQRLFAETVEEEAEIEAEIGWRQSVGKFLGANLDEFMATRLGALLAVAGIAFAIYGLVTATSAWEIAANAFFLVASTLDFFVAVGAWAISMASEAIMVGSVALAAILPWLNVFAVAALIIGAILLIVMMFVDKPPDPIQVFAEGKAKDAGFYMPQKYAIEYFAVFAPKGEPQRIGVSLSEDASGHTFLTIDSGGGLSLGPLDESAQTVFFLKTYPDGTAGIAAPLQDASFKPAAKVLMVDKATKALVAAKPDDSTETDPYARWICVATAPATKNGDNFEAGEFTLVNAGLQADAPTSAGYLGTENGAPSLVSAPAAWTLQMEPVKILGVTMADISLQSDYKDQAFMPHLRNVASGPLHFTLSPSPPDFMTFDSQTGRLAQKPQTAPTVTSATTYTLTVSNAVNQVSTTFSFEVVAAPAAAVVEAVA